VDKSLIRRVEPPGRPSRFSMLETIREFAQERLGASGDPEPGRRAPPHPLLDLAEEAEPHPPAADQGEWLDRCDTEHANIRAALRWAIDRGDAGPAQAAAGALWRFWQQRGHLAEGRRWLQEGLAMASGQGRTPPRAQGRAGAGGIAWWSDWEASRAPYEEALAIERELGDPARLARALYNQAFVVAADHDQESAARLLEESLEAFRPVGGGTRGRRAIARRLGAPHNVAFGLIWLNFPNGRAGRPADARATALEALEL